MANILTLTLNPALDLTVRLAHLEPGEVNRSEALLSHAAGKGVNVAQVLADLGHQLTVSGFLGEDNPQAFEALFKANEHWARDARPAPWGDPEEALIQQRFWVVFDACLNHLPASTARVFMMREFLELETAEICQALEITAGNCNVILHRARNGLRRCLDKNRFSPEPTRC